MQKVQKGFTLIELIVVIVLLGILGVTAMGRFQDLSTDAGAAAVSGIAAEITSASAVNYAASILGNNDVTVRSSGANINADTTTGCSATELGFLLLNDFPTANFSTTNDGSSAACAAAGGSFTCELQHTDSSTTATATIICTGT